MKQASKKRTLKILGVCAACATLITAAACNTTKGAGRDLEKAAQGVQNSAEKHGAD